MATGRFVQAPEKGAAFELVEREVPEPGRGEVVVRVHACGVCHSDSMAKEGAFPGVTFPVVPGHEIAGEVHAVGAGVEPWQEGQRVGVGWSGGNCGWCEACRRGYFISCENMGIPGVTFDGGYADYVVVEASALASIPDDLADEDAAPLLCPASPPTTPCVAPAPAAATSSRSSGSAASVTSASSSPTSSASRPWRSPAAPTRRAWPASSAPTTTSTRPPATPARRWRRWAAPRSSPPPSPTPARCRRCSAGLGVRGKLIAVGASMEPIEVVPAAVIGNNLAVEGHASATSQDSEDTVAFSTLTGVRPRIETLPLERAEEAYDKMMSGDARFRMVLTTTGA